MPIEFGDIMLEHGYSGVRAYCQSKLAQVMFTIDLADELHDRGVTANCLHPATFMPTKIVLAEGVNPISSLEDGIQPALRLVADPQLDDLTGQYFNRFQPAEPHPQAHDPEARRRLRGVSDQLTGLLPTPT
jgi:NAD(P)-dependent dehydrogenase (short-subunit alcohol dehydrogenase family)